jgi:hypothetical protein
VKDGLAACPHSLRYMSKLRISEATGVYASFEMESVTDELREGLNEQIAGRDAKPLVPSEVSS